MFIQTFETPNPHTIKFIPGKTVSDKGNFELSDIVSAGQVSSLAKNILEISGINRVYLSDDFLSVTKDDVKQWDHVKPFVLGAIMEHYSNFVSGVNSFVEAEDKVSYFDEDVSYSAEDQEIVDKIVDLIETRVQPAVYMDGGDIQFRSYKSGKVYLVLRGACAGCPSSSITLKVGIENLLKYYVPEVTEVLEVDI